MFAVVVVEVGRKGGEGRFRSPPKANGWQWHTSALQPVNDQAILGRCIVPCTLFRKTDITDKESLGSLESLIESKTKALCCHLSPFLKLLTLEIM